MVDVDKLKKIRETISEERVNEEKPYAKRDVSAIISRLRAKQLEEITPPTLYESRPLNFKDNVEFPKNATGFLVFVGSFYDSFEKIVSRTAALFSSLPMGRNMRLSLDSGGIALSVETYLVVCSVLAILATIFFGLLFVTVALTLPEAEMTMLSVLAPFLAIFLGVGAGIFGLAYPQMKARARAAEVDRSLPFALRQLSTQVKAGVGFHKAMASIASSGYGVLSDEFSRVVAELNSGSSTEEALSRLALRTRSRGLQRTITQITRSFKTGGNLSAIVSDIAEDVSFETRMSIRDFTEKLNFINIVYIMIAVVAPVVVAVLSAIMQIPMFEGSLPPWFVYGAFTGIAFMMVCVMYVTKSMEPTAW